MKKIILISLFIFFAISSRSWAEDTLKPAADILQSDPSPTTFNYIMIRCGALNYAMEIFLREKGDPNSQEMLDTIESTKKLNNITVLNSAGKRVIILDNNSTFEEQTKIDLSPFTKGLYFIQIKLNNQLINHRIILQ